MISFVHAADLHLDSPFAGLGEVDAQLADLLKSATFQAFENVIELCMKRSADFLLVAGDVYDGADRSLRAQLAFRDGLRKLSEAGIRSFIAHGNHDPLDGWASSLQWPEGTHVFGGREVESVLFERDGDPCAIVHGISFPRRQIKANLARRFKPSKSPVPQIGLLHCNVGGDTGHEDWAPCTLGDLAGAGLDYWALGHVHSRNVLSADNPTVVYPGNTQGRHVNESGDRGCFFVEVSAEKQVRTEFVPTDAVRWANEEISIESIDTDEKLLRALEESVRGIQASAGQRPCVCRLTLSGRGPLHKTLQRPGYAEDLLEQLREYGRDLTPAVWVDRIAVQTRPSVDIASRRQSQDIVGDLLGLVADYRENPDRRSELPDLLRTLYEHRLCRKYLDVPGEEQMLSLLEEAESLCLDRLVEEDS